MGTDPRRIGTVLITRSCNIWNTRMKPCSTRVHARRVLWATVSQYPEYYQVLQFGIKSGIRESTWYLTQNVPAKFRQDL